MKPAVKALSKQQIFTRVAKHLLRQGKKALDASGNCAYRGEDGTKCAIGCLIPDGLYRPWFEGTSPGFWPQRQTGVEIAEVSGLTPETVDFARRLQGIHDSYGVEQWPGRLRVIGDDHDLRLPKELRQDGGQ